MAASHPIFLSAHSLGLTLAGGRVLFRDLSLAFGIERVGLVGRNGVGKSLLLQILAGVREPTTGRVHRAARVAWVPQSALSGRTGAPEPSGARTVADVLGLSERLARVERIVSGSGTPQDLAAVADGDWDLAERAVAVLDALGLEGVVLERPIGSLSGGQATRVRLARPILADVDLLLLDEPTNDLDAESRRALAAFLDSWSGGVLVVSHDRTLLERVDRILELTPGGLREYGGGWALYREVRERERAAARAELHRARTERRRVRVSAQEERERRDQIQSRGRRSRGSGSQPREVLEARRERSEGTRRRTQDMAERKMGSVEERVAAAQARVEEAPELRIELASAELSPRKTVLEVEGVRWTPPGGHVPVLQGVRLRLRGPERVALAGPNGSGKSSLLALVRGELRPDAGSIRLGVDAVEVGHLDQSAELLGRGRSLLAAFRAHHPELDETEARHVLAHFLFPGERVASPVGTLSGGERMRAALACVLGGRRSPKLLLLDEPTNHLDLDSLETLEEVVAGFDGALLVVSHDPRFLEAVGVERTVELPLRY